MKKKKRESIKKSRETQKDGLNKREESIKQKSKSLKSAQWEWKDHFKLLSDTLSLLLETASVNGELLESSIDKKLRKKLIKENKKSSVFMKISQSKTKVLKKSMIKC